MSKSIKRRGRFVPPALQNGRTMYLTCRHCGKRAYASRREARGEARRMSDTTMSAYRCHLATSADALVWHIGHTASPSHTAHLRNLDRNDR